MAQLGIPVDGRCDSNTRRSGDTLGIAFSAPARVCERAGRAAGNSAIGDSSQASTCSIAGSIVVFMRAPVLIGTGTYTPDTGPVVSPAGAGGVRSKQSVHGRLHDRNDGDSRNEGPGSLLDGSGGSTRRRNLDSDRDATAPLPRPSGTSSCWSYRTRPSPRPHRRRSSTFPGSTATSHESPCRRPPKRPAPPPWRCPPACRMYRPVVSADR